MGRIRRTVVAEAIRSGVISGRSDAKLRGHVTDDGIKDPGRRANLWRFYVGGQSARMSNLWGKSYTRSFDGTYTALWNGASPEELLAAKLADRKNHETRQKILADLNESPLLKRVARLENEMSELKKALKTSAIDREVTKPNTSDT